MLHVYGIKNCNTVKKALDWLDEHQLNYTFHDFKKEPATVKKLQEWEKNVDWTTLLNKKGTTWRKLSPEAQSQVLDTPSANTVLAENNSMIKRPVIEVNSGAILVGFDEELYLSTLLK